MYCKWYFATASTSSKIFFTWLTEQDTKETTHINISKFSWMNTHLNNFTLIMIFWKANCSKHKTQCKLENGNVGMKIHVSHVISRADSVSSTITQQIEKVSNWQIWTWMCTHRYMQREQTRKLIKLMFSSHSDSIQGILTGESIPN